MAQQAVAHYATSIIRLACRAFSISKPATIIRLNSEMTIHLLLVIYPSCTLAAARTKWSELKEMLARNIDPAIQKQHEDELTQFQNNTFKLIADEYRKTEELEPSIR